MKGVSQEDRDKRLEKILGKIDCQCGLIIVECVGGSGGATKAERIAVEGCIELVAKVDSIKDSIRIDIPTYIKQ